MDMNLGNLWEMVLHKGDCLLQPIESQRVRDNLDTEQQQGSVLILFFFIFSCPDFPASYEKEIIFSPLYIVASFVID